MPGRPSLTFDYHEVNELLEAHLNAAIEQFLAGAMFMADLKADTLYAVWVESDDEVRAESLRDEVLYEVRDYAKLWRGRGGGSPEQRADIEEMRAVLAEWLAEVDEVLAMPDLPA